MTMVMIVMAIMMIRIKEAGGDVQQIRGTWRVCTLQGAAAAAANSGMEDHEYLAVARAFGDTALKQPMPLVISTPEIEVIVFPLASPSPSLFCLSPSPTASPNSSPGFLPSWHRY